MALRDGPVLPDRRLARSHSAPRRTGRTIVVDALAARFGGTACAAVEVAKRLGDVTVVTREGSLVAAGLADSDVRVVALPDVRRAELAHRVSWEAFGLRRADAVLSWSGMLPRRVPGRLVCVLANPLLFTGRGHADMLRRVAVRRTVADAASVVVPSEAMRTLAERLVGPPVEVVHLGVDLNRFAPGALPGTDVLCVADFYAHKRHDIVLDAWAALPAPRPRLRLIGNPRTDPATYARVRALASGMAGLGEITFEHGLPVDEFAEAYRSARVVMVASEKESFCLPLLEAQACGTPVIVPEDPALRTAGGPGAVYVGDGSWTPALRRMLTDDVAYAAAREAGLAHAARFSWDRTAAELRARLLEA